MFKAATMTIPRNALLVRLMLTFAARTGFFVYRDLWDNV